jgi:hypothetical protein
MFHPYYALSITITILFENLVKNQFWSIQSKLFSSQGHHILPIHPIPSLIILYPYLTLNYTPSLLLSSSKNTSDSTLQKTTNNNNPKRLLTMSKKIFFTLAAAALLLSAPAFAQEEPPATTEEPPATTEEPVEETPTETTPPVEEAETEEPAPAPISSCCKKQTVTVENVESQGSTIVLINSEATGIPLTGANETQELDQGTVDEVTAILDQLASLVLTPAGNITNAITTQVNNLTTRLGTLLKGLADAFSPAQLAELLPEGLVERIEEIQTELETAFPLLTSIPTLEELFPISDILDILFPNP